MEYLEEYFRFIQANDSLAVSSVIAAGVGIATTATSIVVPIGTASTGTAATNATLAAIDGGSLAGRIGNNR